MFEADIHVPDGEGPSPVVVMFHGNAPSGKDDSYTTVVAEAAAAAGMHVFVPNWLTGTRGITPERFDVFHAAANCAVAYAQSNLGDATPVVVHGFSAGVGPASEAVLDPAREPVPGCVADDVPTPIAAAVFGDGEYFLHSSVFDGAFAADPVAVHGVVARTVDPKLWPSDMGTRFFLWIADGGTLPRAFDDPWDETGWLAQRDPDGSIRRDLERLGQLDDGVVSFIDEGQLMELRLREAGVEVSLDNFPGGHTTFDKVPELVSYLVDAAAVDWRRGPSASPPLGRRRARPPPTRSLRTSCSRSTFPRPPYPTRSRASTSPACSYTDRPLHDGVCSCSTT